MAADPVAWLFGLEQFGIKLGLENITTLLHALGRPDRAFTSVHVAGTNGKGSATAMVESCLRAAGHRTGRYTSPHLVDVRERFVVNGELIAQELFVQVVDDVRTVVDRLIAEGRLAVSPTFFEITTAVALEVFRRADVEVAVCEVGLGGRLDATNVLEPRVSAITSIGFDHERHLGATLAAIAGEKAGILKRGVPVVVGRLPDEARRIIAAVAASVGAPLLDASADVRFERTGPDEAPVTRGHLRTGRRDYGEVTIALRGTHQIGNAAVAVCLLETLDAGGVSVPPEAVARGLASVAWPGRLERRVFADGREVLLDAAHNPDGAATLAEFLRDIGAEPRPLVFAAMRDKNIRGMLRALLPAASALVVTRASNVRSEDPEVIATVARALAPGIPVTVELSPPRAMALAWAVSPSIVVAGSLFLLGDVISVLEGP